MENYLGSKDSPLFLAKVLPQEYWTENSKAGGKKIGNRAKILIYGVHINGDSTGENIKPEELPWGWSITPPTQAVAAQNLRGGETVVGMWADKDHNVPIILGHIQKTEQFEVEKQKSEVKSSIEKGEFSTFEGKGGKETPNIRLQTPSGGKTILESPKNIDDALNKGSLYNLKTEFPITLGMGFLDIGNILKSLASGSFSLESLAGDLLSSVLPESLGSLAIPGTNITVDLNSALKSAAQGLISGQGVGNALGALGGAIGNDLAGRFTDVINNKMDVFEGIISSSLGNIPGVGDLTGKLSSKITSLTSTIANDLITGAFKGEVDFGNISKDIAAQLSKELGSSINVLSLDALSGVADGFVKEVIGSLSGVLPEGLDITSIVPSLSVGSKSGFMKGIDVSSIETMVAGGDYGFSRKISSAFDSFSYATTSVVKINDIYIDPVTESIVDINILKDDLKDELSVAALTFFNNLESSFSESIVDYVALGIENPLSGLRNFPTVGAATSIAIETSSSFVDYVPEYSLSNSIFPFITPQEATPILSNIENNVLTNLENILYDNLENILKSGDFENGVRELIDKLLLSTTSTDDTITYEFSVALCAYTIALIEKKLISSSTLSFPISQLFTLGSGVNLGENGAISNSIVKNLVISALGTGISSQQVAKYGFGGKGIPGVYNDSNLNDKIKNEVSKIHSVIGYGNSKIDDIIGQLKVFSAASKNLNSVEVILTITNGPTYGYPVVESNGVYTLSLSSSSVQQGVSRVIIRLDAPSLANGTVVPILFTGPEVYKNINMSSGEKVSGIKNLIVIDGTSSLDSFVEIDSEMVNSKNIKITVQNTVIPEGAKEVYSASAITQLDNVLSSFGLQQYSPSKVTTGTGAKLKADVNYLRVTDLLGNPLPYDAAFSGIDSDTGRKQPLPGTIITKTKVGISSLDVSVINGGTGYNKNIPPTVIFLRNPPPTSGGVSYQLAEAGFTEFDMKSIPFSQAKGDVMINNNQIIGVHIKDEGSGYFYGSTIVVDTTHPKTASGEKFKINLVGSEIIGIGAHYNPNKDIIRIRYIDENGDVIETIARATSINPVGLSTSPNELVQIKTIVSADGTIQQLKKVENFSNLTLQSIKSIHQKDNVITTITYETSYITGITRLVGILTAFSPFVNSLLLTSNTSANTLSSGIANIPDSSGINAIFEFDNGAIAEILYGPGGQIVNLDFNKYIDNIASMPEIFVDSDTGTGFEVELKLKFDLIEPDKQNNLNNQIIETIGDQLYVDSNPVFGQNKVEISIDCIGGK
jgi:hypothetical protein